MGGVTRGLGGRAASPALLGVELCESVFSSDDTVSFNPLKPRFVVMYGAATKRPGRFRVLLLLDPQYVWINVASQRGDIYFCVG